MRVSVLCPSRLQKNLAARPDAGDLYLDRALMSAKRNASDAGVELELIVGLDPGSVLPGRFSDVKVAYGTGGQASAVNAAARLMTGDVVAIIEEDDFHGPGKLAIQLDVLSRGYEFVSCTQKEVDEQANFIRYNCFPTPSGWVMPRATWDRVGPFDETFKYHVDTEWLGRANAAKVKRCHVLHVGADTDPWVANVHRFSGLANDDEITEPLVTRLDNEHGGMAAIKADGKRLAGIFVGPQGAFMQWVMDQPASPYVVSVKEHQRMAEKFSGVSPW